MSSFARVSARVLGIWTAFVLALCLSLPALGMTLEEAKAKLDQAKQEGYLGEKATGYLGVVEAGGNAAAIAEAINEARREEYRRIAEKHNLDVTKVEAVAGKKAIEKTPPGQYVMVEGEWVRK